MASLSVSLTPALGEDEKDARANLVSKNGGDKKKSIRKRLGLSSKTKRDSKNKSSRSTSKQASGDNNNNNPSSTSSILVDLNESSSSSLASSRDGASASTSTSASGTKIDGAAAASIATGGAGKSSKRGGRDEKRGSRIGRVVRSLSRSRSSRHKRNSRGDGSDTDASSDQSSSSEGRRNRATVVTVTSCRSDGYYNQKAPGSTSKLPRKAPTNLKLFHELAVGLKDAFTAVGQTPTKPQKEEEITDEATGETKTVTVMTDEEFAGRTILWDFMGNIDFVSPTSSRLVSHWSAVCCVVFALRLLCFDGW